MPVISRLTEEHLISMFKEHATDPDWPRTLRTEKQVRQFLSELQLARFSLSTEEAYALCDETHRPIGFLTLSSVSCPGAETDVVVEFGTYLVPSVRGFGYNQLLKTFGLARAFEVSFASWVIFVIHPNNTRALKGLYKLPWPMYSSDSNEKEPPLFASAARYKRYKLGHACTIIGISRDDWRK